MSIKLVAAAAVSILTLASPAFAQDSNLAAREIMTGSYATAEQKLLNQMRLDQRPELQLNLAAVYYATGRVDEALGWLPEDEPDRPRAVADRQLGVLEPGDAADLDPRHCSTFPVPSCASRAATRASRARVWRSRASSGKA